MHYSRIHKMVIDVPEETHDREVAFWAAATGTTLEHYRRYPEYHGTMLPGDGMGLLVQRLGDGEPRVHLDIHTDNVEAEVARLESLGAQRVQGVNHWVVMRDPAGLPFCVIPDRNGALNDSNATRWG